MIFDFFFFFKLPNVMSVRYHFDGTARLFFEGWYFKVSIPESRQTFCFMYSVENPAFPNGMSTLDKAIHGPRFTGVGAQILGADDKYICQYVPESKNFWGSKFIIQTYILIYISIYMCVLVVFLCVCVCTHSAEMCCNNSMTFR